MNAFDVVIVGGGLVGQAIAAALTTDHNGPRVALVDPAEIQPPPAIGSIQDYDLRVSALTARSQDFLTRIGAWNRIPADRLSPYRGMHVWDAEGTGSVTFDAADMHAPELGHIVENRETVYALSQALAGRELTRLQDTVASFTDPDENGRLSVTLGSGDTLTTRLIIGADGALSGVRQFAGIPTREWDYDHHAIVATVECEQPLQATAWQRFRPQGPLALLPLHSNPHLASIVWSTSPDEAAAMLALDDDAFCEALGQAFEYRLGKILASSARASFPLRQRHARNYYSHGVVLAGDAAHTIHPLAGQGVNLGFKDAEVLAEEILRAYRMGLSPGEDAVLARYQRRRQGDNLATMATMEGFKRLFAADQPLVRLLRNEGMRIFDRVMPLKKQAMIKAMGL
ncbi:MAG TPA: 2-octaprenyl-3-methyl-6-methoxy-1,4-benzoquinol hydroxylase [Oceanospirillales bacterium]|nr:2-octaprenyl-3-methyl-6-methoxy-1,4-benzoquinol hydroxylase [Oceanospirillaceae bacterium]HBS41126.1 2-octaprenyl-3-methyl-6-methoxy-1,4-benzoquinol hydroxylase [Oceanospirillales bacterium]|tara:strand:- start:9568 stop:10764 length:1197 start_codon:yes stop_codon:yes gene_type:complete